MTNWDHCDTVSRASVGLHPRRPFRFCTLHYDCEKRHYVQPGDDLFPGEAMDRYGSRRALISYAPAQEEHHRVKPHRHAFYELVLIRDGTAIHECHHGKRSLSRGDVLILTPKSAHAYTHIDHLVKTNLYVQPEWLLDDLRLLWDERGLVRYLLANALFRGALGEDHFHLTLEEDEVRTCEEEIDALTREAMKQDPSLAFYNACFLKILCGFNQAFERHSIAYPAALPLTKELWAAVSSIERLILQNKPFHVEELAKQLGLRACNKINVAI